MSPNFMVVFVPFALGISQPDGQTSVALANSSFTVTFLITAYFTDPFIGALHVSLLNIIRIGIVFQQLVAVPGISGTRVFDIFVHLHALVTILLDLASSVNAIHWSTFLFRSQISFRVVKSSEAVATVVTVFSKSWIMRKPQNSVFQGFEPSELVQRINGRLSASSG